MQDALGNLLYWNLLPFPPFIQKDVSLTKPEFVNKFILSSPLKAKIISDAELCSKIGSFLLVGILCGCSKWTIDNRNAAFFSLAIYSAEYDLL